MANATLAKNFARESERLKEIDGAAPSISESEVLEPMPGYFAARLLKEARQSKGGILIPDGAQQRHPTRAEVIAVGEKESPESPFILSPGDIVWVLEYAGHPIPLDGGEVRLFKFEEAYAKIRTAAR